MHGVRSSLLSLSKQKLCGPEKKERLPREPKQKSKLSYQTKEKAAIPKQNPLQISMLQLLNLKMAVSIVK